VLCTVLHDRTAFQTVDVHGVKSYELTIAVAFERVLRTAIPLSDSNGVPNEASRSVSIGAGSAVTSGMRRDAVLRLDARRLGDRRVA
jgi:hypothetical protein